MTGRRVGVIVLVALLAGCSGNKTGVSIQGDHDPTISFASFRTYGWVPARYSPSVSGRTSGDPFLEARLRSIPQVIERELAAKGFARADTGQPDFRVAYRVATERGQIDSFGDFARYRRSGGSKDMGTSWVRGYEKGALTIDIVDSAGTRLLWRRTATAVVDDTIPATARQARLEGAIRRMLEAFPPK